MIPAGTRPPIVRGALRATLSVVIIFACAGCYVSNPRGARPGDWQDASAVSTPPRESVSPSSRTNETSRLPPTWPVAVLREADPVPPRGAVPPLSPPAPVAASAPSTVNASNRVIIPTGQWISLTQWTENNRLPGPSRVANGGSTTFSFATPSGVLVVRGGSQLAHWDGIEVRLGVPVQLMDGQPCVHSVDLIRTIAPLASGLAQTSFRSNRVVVIDPGHGGEDSGTRSVLGPTYEKEYTLDWARRLAGSLATRGWTAYLTRTGDTELSLSNRVAFAEQHKAGLFLSLHFNSAAPDESEAGLETYCLTPAGVASTVTRDYLDDTAQAYPNNAYDLENLRLAIRVHQGILQVNGHRDRGVRRARFLGVLRNQQRAAILVEGGYLSNAREAQMIAQPEYRQRLAQAVADALEDVTTTERLAAGTTNDSQGIAR